MTISIEDGTGEGYRARVNDRNRLSTNSVIISDDGMSIIDGKSFFSFTSDITLTGTGTSAVQYLKNTGDEDIIVTTLGVSTGTSANGTGEAIVETIRNPTGGTIVDTATDATLSNSNFGSSKTISIDSYEGTDGATLTGGTQFSKGRFISPLFVIADFNVVIPPGASIGINYTPQPNNTSVVVSTALNFHLDGFAE